MGSMKDLYTQIQEMGINPVSPEGSITLENIVKQNHKQFKDLGEIKDLPDGIKEIIRNWNPNGAFEEAVQQKFQHAKHVLLSKHKDYGPKNISQSPGGPLNGLRVRMWDKLARINNLVDSGAEPANESLKDSFLDLANYAIIAMMVLDGEWDNRG